MLTCRWSAAGLRIAEVPSHEKLRVHGASNLNAVTDGIRVLTSIVHERRRASGRRAVSAAPVVAAPVVAAPVVLPAAAHAPAAVHPASVHASPAGALEGDAA